MAQYEAYQNALGIRTIAFHRPDDPVTAAAASPICPSQLLAIGSYDGQIRLLSSRSWKLAFVLPLVHPSEMVDCLRGDVVMTVEVIEASDTLNTSNYDYDQSQAMDISLFSAK
jgi:WD40 repeat protein